MSAFRAVIAVLSLSLAACHPARDARGEAQGPPWAGLAPGEGLHLAGSDPAWSGEIAGGVLTWRFPAEGPGRAVAVARFAGRNGLGFAGTLASAPIGVAVSAAACSDPGLAGRYPFTVTVQLPGRTLLGCGWSDAHPAISAH